MTVSMNKYELVRDKLAEAIKSRQMRSGERLPSERKLAEQYKVSYLTIRRAIGDLVDAELLERRARMGTFVSEQAISRTAGKSVNIICSSYESLTARTFVGFCLRQTEKRDRIANIIELAHSNESSVAKIILGPDPTVIFASGPELKGRIGAAIQQASNRTVLVGNRLDGLGVPSVMMDDGHGVRMAIEHLREHGHTKIGLITSDATHLVSRIFHSVWQSECGAQVPEQIMEKRTLAVTLPRFECPALQAYESTKAYLKKGRPDVTAFLCQVDEMAPGILAAFREAGIRVPENMSLITFGNTASSLFSQPPLTSIDANLDAHVEFAFSTIDAAAKGELTPADLFKLVQPQLVIRESVAELI